MLITLYYFALDFFSDVGSSHFLQLLLAHDVFLGRRNFRKSIFVISGGTLLLW